MSYYSLEHSQILPPVRNQRDTSTCWAFAAAGVLSAWYARFSGKLVILSVQHLIDAMPHLHTKNNKPDKHGCFGQHAVDVFSFVKRNGVCLERDYRFKGYRTDPNDLNIRPEWPRLRMGDFVAVHELKRVHKWTQQRYDDYIDGLILNGQPLVGTILTEVTFSLLGENDMYNGVPLKQQLEALELLRKNEMTGEEVEIPICGHSMMIIGCATDDNGVRYFRCQNSWGKNWCTRGFCSIPRHLFYRISHPLFCSLDYSVVGKSVTFSQEEVQVASDNRTYFETDDSDEQLVPPGPLIRAKKRQGYIFNAKSLLHQQRQRAVRKLKKKDYKGVVPACSRLQVSNIVEADAEVLWDKLVQTAVEARSCDSTISVREAALEFFGRHMASHPDVGLKYFEKLAERTKDTGAIRIIKDMCTSNANFSEYTTACIEIISRVNDDESSIQDLVCKTFYEFWFEDSPNPQSHLFGDGSSVSLDVAKKTEQIVGMLRRMPGHQLLVTVIKRNLALDFLPQSAKAVGINPVSLASVRRRCELICKCLLEKILEVVEMNNEEGEARMLPYILLLHAFCVVDPSLCAPASDPSQFVVTLQPYLKSQADNWVVAQLLESIIFIIDSVLPLLRKLPQSVIEEVEQDLKQMIVRHPFLTVVHACIKCLCSVSRVAGKGATVVAYLLLLFYKRLEALGFDNKQIQPLQNMYGYLLDAENQMRTDAANKDEVNCSIDVGHIVPVAAGAGDTNICGGIVQLYWDAILGRCLDVNEQVRQSALKILEAVLRQKVEEEVTGQPAIGLTQCMEGNMNMIPGKLNGISREFLQKVQADFLGAAALQFVFYILNDARCEAYSPTDPPKPGENLMRQNIPFTVGEISIDPPCSYEDFVQRYQAYSPNEPPRPGGNLTCRTFHSLLGKLAFRNLRIL